MRRVNKSVVFNRDDPDQDAMLEHAEQRSNFSAYVKRLIYADLKRTVTVEPSPPDTKIMEGFI